MILNEFKIKNENRFNSITIERYKADHNPKDSRYKNIRTEYTYHHLSTLRNKILNFTSVNNFDYCLSIDSDILVPSNILKKLLSHKKDVVSGVIFNGYLVNPTHPWKYPNIMRLHSSGKFEHIANSYVKKSPTLTDSKLTRIDGTGAMVLISKDVCKDTKYGFHEQGEDLFWSLDCLRKGFNLYADYSVHGFHAMTKDLLVDELIKSNQIINRENKNE